MQYDLLLPSSVQMQIGRHRPLDVVRDEEVELAVLVVVEPERAGRESAVRDASLLGHVRETPAAQISKQAVAAKRRDVDIRVAVVVEVGGRPAHPVDLHVEPRPARDVGEDAVHVSIERRPRPGLLRGGRVEAPAVDEQHVLPAVSVHIEEHDAGAHRLGQVFLAEASVRVNERDAGGRRRVAEDHRFGGRQQRGAQHTGTHPNRIPNSSIPNS